MSEVKEKKQSSVVSKIFNAVLWVFLAFAIVVTVFAFMAQADDDGVPAIFGKAILSVETESMNRPDGQSNWPDGSKKAAFTKGSIIIGTKLTADEQRNLKVGNIITFKAKADFDKNGTVEEIFLSHRIVEVRYNTAGDVVGYITQGDNAKTNPVNDQISYGIIVSPSDVVCEYHGTHIGGLGHVLDFLQSPTGFLICIVLPMLAFFVYELVNFIRTYMAVKNAGKKVISAEDEEMIKQKAVEEYMKKMAEQQLAQTSEQSPAESEENKAE